MERQAYNACDSLVRIIHTRTSLPNFFRDQTKMLSLRDQVRIVGNDLRPVVNILTIVFLIFAILTALARLYTKAKMVGRLNEDDFTMLVAVVRTESKIVDKVSLDMATGFVQRSVSFHADRNI